MDSLTAVFVNEKAIRKSTAIMWQRERESFGERLNQIWKQVFSGEDIIHTLGRNSNFKEDIYVKIEKLRLSEIFWQLIQWWKVKE